MSKHNPTQHPTNRDPKMGKMTMSMMKKGRMKPMSEKQMKSQMKKMPKIVEEEM